jgi:16S rRNA processing protein RimM
VQIKGISDRSKARNVTNSDIVISKKKLSSLKKNEYYWNDIINYEVFNVDKHYLGKVTSLIRTKNNDILIIKNPLEKLNKNILIPFIENQIIKNIDTHYKYIIVQWN